MITIEMFCKKHGLDVDPTYPPTAKEVGKKLRELGYRPVRRRDPKTRRMVTWWTKDNHLGELREKLKQIKE